MAKRAWVLAAMAGVTVLAGVNVFAARCDRAELGDGPLPYRDVLTAGALMLVLPWSLLALGALRRSGGDVVPVAVSSLGLALAVALGRPGNLFMVGLYVYMWGAVVLWAVVDAALHWLRRRRHPISRYRGLFKSPGPSTDQIRRDESESARRDDVAKAQRVGLKLRD